MADADIEPGIQGRWESLNDPTRPAWAVATNDLARANFNEASVANIVLPWILPNPPFAS
jgi:hypothetical protein